LPPVQPSIALESYLENVKTQLTEITVTTCKPKNNLSSALKELKNNSALNLKKQTKVQQQSSSVIMNKTEKMKGPKCNSTTEFTTNLSKH